MKQLFSVATFAKETKPGELGSIPEPKSGSKESGPGWSRTKPEKKPLPTKAELVTRKPSRDYQAEKEAQKETDKKTESNQPKVITKTVVLPDGSYGT